MSEKDVDRISELPDSLIHLIFSFMDMTEVVHTSLLSKRWRYLWVTNPYVNLSLDDGLQLQLNADIFADFVDGVLFHRDDSNIQKFSLSFNLLYDYPDIIEKSIATVMKRNVQEVH
ncbi:hypothetical protein ACHQM5_002936 [Ranunculus cassubicifolius]